MNDERKVGPWVGGKHFGDRTRGAACAPVHADWLKIVGTAGLLAIGALSLWKICDGGTWRSREDSAADV